MKQTVTISNKHLKRIFNRHNLPETAERGNLRYICPIETNNFFIFDENLHDL